MSSSRPASRSGWVTPDQLSPAARTALRSYWDAWDASPLDLQVTVVNEQLTLSFDAWLTRVLGARPNLTAVSRAARSLFLEAARA